MEILCGFNEKKSFKYGEEWKVGNMVYLRIKFIVNGYKSEAILKLL